MAMASLRLVALVGLGTLPLHLAAAACTSSTSAPPGSLCCPADAALCGIPTNDAGQCLACCRGDSCGFPPEADGACLGLDQDAGPACVSTADCATGQVCGFSIFEACQSTGTCIAPAPCPTTGTFCGCGGAAVVCVAPAMMSGPVEKEGPCGEAGAD